MISNIPWVRFGNLRPPAKSGVQDNGNAVGFRSRNLAPALLDYGERYTSTSLGNSLSFCGVLWVDECVVYVCVNIFTHVAK